MTRFAVLLALLSASLLHNLLATETIRYPADAGVIDVTAAPWYVDNTGTADVTAKLNTIFKTYASEGDGPNRIIYLPNGTYLVSDRLLTNANTTGDSLGGFLLQGESRDGTVIRLRDGTAGGSYTDAAGEWVPATGDFSDPTQPLPVLSLFEGASNNDAFYNMVENITIDTGSGNPGAIGLRFFANNTGAIRSVAIRSSDPNRHGVAGLDLRTPVNGQSLIRDLSVTGFDYGIWSSDGLDGHPFTMEHIALSGQRVAGIFNDYRTLPIRGLSSTNSVPAILHSDHNNRAQAGIVLLLDSQLQGGSSGNSGVVVEDGYLYLRHVSQAGYAAVADLAGVPLAGDYSTGEYISGPVVRNWGTTPAASLGLPIVETPSVPWDAPADWAILEPRGGGLDDTENIRRAMESGKSTVYFKTGRYRISETITIGRQVRRVMGQWSELTVMQPLRASSDPIFRLGESTHPAVLFERFRSPFGLLDPAPYLIRHESGADLVLRDVFWVQSAVYRNAPNGGRLFVENVHSLPGTQTNLDSRPAWIIRDQAAWFRAVNPEMQTPHIVNDGGQVWVFGGKFGEQQGPVVKTLNFGRTEILGALQNVTHNTGPDDPNGPAIVWSENGQVSAILVERAKQSWGAHPVVVREQRGGETRELLQADFPLRDGDTLDSGVVVPFYAGYLDPATVGNAPPVVSAPLNETSVFPNPLPLSATATDDGNPTGFLATSWDKVSGPGTVIFADPAALSTSATFSRPGDYQLRFRATDGLATTEQTVNVSVPLGNLNLSAIATATVEDAAPRDGLGDQITPAELRVGDGTFNQEQVGLLDFELRSLEGQGGAIEAARLRLTLKTRTGGVGMVTLYRADEGYGQHGIDDLAVPATAIDSVDLSGLALNESVTFDLTQELWDALSAGQNYLSLRLRVAALNLDGQGDHLVFYDLAAPEDLAPAIEVLADTDAPASLTAEASPTAFDRIDLTWIDQSAIETGYHVEQKTEGGNWSEVAVLPADSSSVALTGLTEATTYYHRVRAALPGGGFSSFSNTAAATTVANAPPSAPTGLTVTVVSTRQINLSWTDNADNEVSVVVERSVDGGSWQTLVTLPRDRIGFVDTDVVGSAHYRYRVYAQNSAGASSTTTAVDGTTPGMDSIDPDLLHLDFEATSGTVAADQSGSGLDFTLQNMNFADNGIEFENGTRALGFENWDSVYRNDFTYGPDFTLSIWFRITDGNEGGGLRYLFSHGDTTADSQYLHVAIGEKDSFSAPDKITTRLKDSNDPQNDEVLNIPVESVGADDGQWHLYTLTVSSVGVTRSRVFIDGVEMATSSQGGDLFDPVIDNSGQRVRVGMRSQFSSTTSFDGGLDDLRLFSRALSVEEVETLYGIGPSGSGKTPGIPANLRAGEVTESAVQLVWEDTDDRETSFEIQRDQGSGWQALPTVVADATGVTDSTVSPDTTYLYRMRAVGEAGYSAWSDTLAVITQTGGGPIPGPWRAVDLGTVAIPGSQSHSAPAGGVFSMVSSGQRLNGNADQGRFIYRELRGDGSMILRVDDLQTAAPANGRAGLMLRESLDAGARTLFAHLDQNSAIQYYRRTATGTSTTTGLADAAASTWFRIERTGDQFTASHSADGVSWVPFSGINVQNPVTLSNLPETVYVGMVAAAGYDPADLDTHYLASVRFSQAAVTGQAPEAPREPQAVAVGPDRIDLSWTDFSDNETSYRVERKAGLAGSWAEITGGLSADSASFSDTSLAPDTTYYYRIQAVNTEGASSYSPQIFARTEPAPLPASPTGLTATAGGVGALVLSWSDVANEASYRIERREGLQGTWIDLGVSLPADQTSYTDSHLPSGTLYSYRVSAVNTTGSSAPSGVATATTLRQAVTHPASVLNWYRGNTNSGSTLVQQGESLTVFSGTSGGSELHTTLTAYFEAITLEASETLRLRFDLRFDASPPNVGQSIRFGLLDSQGIRLEADTGGNNPPERRNDRGYGIALGTGGSTITRYIEEPGSATAFNPFIYEFNQLGGDPRSYGINDTSTHAVVFELRRVGDQLEIAAYFDGAVNPYDGGRVIAVPATFSFDSLAFDLRSQGVEMTLGNLEVQHFTSFAPTAREDWRLLHFGNYPGTGTTADLSDPDADSWVNLLEYALSGNPLAAENQAPVSAEMVGSAGEDYPALRFTRNQEATDLNWIVERSTDLKNWSPIWDFQTSDPALRMQVLDHGDGTETLTIRDSSPIQHESVFLRLRVESL